MNEYVEWADRVASLEARVVELERMLAERVENESKSLFDLSMPELRERLDRWKDREGPFAADVLKGLGMRIEMLERENAG
jgi:hypothetical protein